MATKRILETQDVDNRRVSMGNPNGLVYGQRGWTCQDWINGTLWVCRANGVGNWTDLLSAGSTAWGDITGMLTDQTDLIDYLVANYQPNAGQGLSASDSPTFLQGSFASLFDGTGGNVADAGGSRYYSGFFGADSFFGDFWGTPTFNASNLFVGMGTVASLFNGTGGNVSVAQTALYASGYAADTGTLDANQFFGIYWGSPDFNGENVYGYADGLSVANADTSHSSDYSSLYSGIADSDNFFGASWGNPTFDAVNLFGVAGGLSVGNADTITGNFGVAMIIVNAVPYYPHVTAGVLTFTDTP